MEAILTLERCHDLLAEAHRYLAERGQQALRRAAEVNHGPDWGRALKRVRVLLDNDDGKRPGIVHVDKEGHSFAEVVNRCATRERLIDALKWAQGAASGLAVYHVACCHPTTSSGRKGEGTSHDLVLRGPGGEAAWFEVSEVASTKDGNGKEEKDLRSLGLLPANTLSWPKARVFLVVSREFAERLEKPRKDRPTYRLHPFPTTPADAHTTVIAEAIPPAP